MTQPTTRPGIPWRVFVLSAIAGRRALSRPRHAIDTHTKRSRPTVAEVVEKIGPMRNKVAAEQGSEVRRERRGRRG